MKPILWWKNHKQNGKLNLPSAGIYHFANQTDENKNRIHLRIEQDGAGLLMINAARAYHLNPSATSMAYWKLSGGEEKEIVHSLKHNFKVAEEAARSDTTNFLDTFTKIINPIEICPICELDLDLDLPFSHTPSAPYRMDLAMGSGYTSSGIHRRRTNTASGSSETNCLCGKKGANHRDQYQRQKIGRSVLFAQFGRCGSRPYPNHLGIV
jgi:hypothetical protein